MRAGQPPLDLAYRARNWLWYWLVKCASDLSDDDLDRLFGSAGLGKRPRTFYRFRTLGSSPTDRRGYRKSGVSVFDTLHGESNPNRARYEIARRSFSSELWELLTQRELPVARLEAIVESILIKRGLTRIRQAEISLLRDVVDDPLVLVGLGHTRSDAAALAPFDDDVGLEVVTLLGCLYRLSISGHQLERAVALRDATERLVVLFTATWQAPEFLASLLLRLVRDRILGSTWVTEMDWRKSNPVEDRRKKQRNSEAKRRQEIHALVHWYAFSPRDAGHGLPENAGLPIPLTPALQWTRERADTLEAVRLAANWHRGEATHLADSEDPRDIERRDTIAARAGELKASLTRFIRGLLDSSGDAAASSAAKPAVVTGPRHPESVSDLMARIDEEDREAARRARQAHRNAHRQAVELTATPEHALRKPKSGE